MAYHDDQVVETRHGPVRGTEDREETWRWRAIPFARPPVGELRWKAPRAPDPWTEVREPSGFARLACQAVARENRDRTSEDCLYLNIWRPRTRETGLPVYLWIHGGGNTLSMPTPEQSPGSAIARRSNVVFVSIQYRLGEFGWFTHPALRSGKPGDEHDDSGNYGTLDIIQSLRWVRDNIEAFGGDPGCVFVTGESAGAFNTLTLLISPAAHGLFHRAMAQSGRQNTHSIAAADRHAEAILAQLLIQDALAADREEAAAVREKMTDEEITRYLHAKGFVDFLRARRRVGFIAAFRDGAVLHADGFDALKTGAYPNKVPAIVGMNKEEAKFQLALTRAWERLDDEVYQGVARYLSDHKKATGMDDILRALVSHPDQPPVYGYQMMWGACDASGRSPAPEPAASRVGACHGIDIPFFFGQERGESALGVVGMGFTEENRAGRRALSRAMMAYAAEFARTGNPNPPGSQLPTWTPWSNLPGGDKAILFDVEVHGDRARLAMSREELTEAAVDAALASVSEPLRSQIRELAAASRRLMP